MGDAHVGSSCCLEPPRSSAGRLPGSLWSASDPSFVSAHLEAHDHNIATRNEQYNTILSSLVFRGGDALHRLVPAQPHHSSHLFVMGDLNYRLERLPGPYPSETGELVALERERAALVALDTLKREQAAGRVFGGLREGDLTRFAPTYKRIVGQVEGYSQ